MRASALLLLHDSIRVRTGRLTTEAVQGGVNAPKVQKPHTLLAYGGMAVQVLKGPQTNASADITAESRNCVRLRVSADVQSSLCHSLRTCPAESRRGDVLYLKTRPRMLRRSKVF